MSGNDLPCPHCGGDHHVVEHAECAERMARVPTSGLYLDAMADTMTAYLRKPESRAMFEAEPVELWGFLRSAVRQVVRDTRDHYKAAVESQFDLGHSRSIRALVDAQAKRAEAFAAEDKGDE